MKRLDIFESVAQQYIRRVLKASSSFRDSKLKSSNYNNDIKYYKPHSAFKIKSPLFQSLVQLSLKNLIDKIFSLICLIVCFPVMIVIALLIKLSSHGPVFYMQTRIGINRRKRKTLTDYLEEKSESIPRRRNHFMYGRPFRMIKFRTMTPNAEANGPVWCCTKDSRITFLGMILRKTHLDELPQLFNIIKGEMSLVGPRPERPEFVTELVQTVPNYERRLLLKPGLTGLAQIHHRSDQNITDVKKKLKYDLAYIRSATILTDIKIILSTFPFLLGFSPDRVNRFYRKINLKITDARCKLEKVFVRSE